MRQPTIILACLLFCGYALAASDTTVIQLLDDNPAITRSDDTIDIQLPDNTNTTQSSDDATITPTSSDTVIVQSPYTQPPCDTAVEPETVYIRGIEIYGNVNTRVETLTHFFKFEIGDRLDTAKLNATRADIIATQLYDRVDIFPRMREDGAHIFVILREAVRLQLGYGGEYSTRRYGYSDVWYRFNIYATFENFRGRMEEFSFDASIWDYRALSLSWYKPLLPTPYYMSVSAGIAGYPHESLPFDYMDVYARAMFGRKLNRNTRISVSAFPVYRRMALVPWAVGGGGQTSELNDSSSLGEDIYEAFAALNFTTDFSSARFDPKSGWVLYSQLRTNRLHAGANIPFFQLSNDFRYYQPLFFNGMGSFRIKQTLRDIAASEYHRLAYGSAGEIRGYGNNVLGWQFLVNSSLLTSVKFHQPLFNMPPQPIPWISLLFSGVNRISYRLDATLIADYAALYNDPLGALTFDGLWQEGVGLGFGTRLVIPEIRQSGCIDLVWGRHDRNDWRPVVHIYLDLFF